MTIRLSPRQANDAARYAAHKARSAVLVSVPTSSTAPHGGWESKGLPDEIVVANLTHARKATARAAGAFLMDSGARRLSQLRCAVGFSARLHQAQAVEPGHRPWRAWMVTATYADAAGWRSDHWKKAIHAVRQWCNRQGFPFRYVWVAEIQTKRAERTGASVIHYHAVVWLPQGVRMPKWDVRGWWEHGRCQRVPVRRSAVGYLMKYLSKGAGPGDFKLPKGARCYGTGGLAFTERRCRRWLRLPAHVQANSSIWDDWNRRIGGGWLSPSGEHRPSEFVTTSVGGLRALVRVHEHARVIDASGPFAWLTDRTKALAVQGAKIKEQRALVRAMN